MSEQETADRLLEGAAQVGRAVDLFDVRVVSVVGEAPSTQHVGQPLGVLTEIEALANQEAPTVLQIQARYVISAHLLDDEKVKEPSPDSPVAWRIEVVLAASFRREEGPKFTDVQIQGFTATTGMLAIHPYAREFAQSLSGRMGYPPFTLELIHVAGAGMNIEQAPEGDEALEQ